MAVGAKTTSCGVIVTDGVRLLLGHATRSPRWDIPKGEAEPGESYAGAARRELFEETGLDAPEAELRALGVFPYRRRNCPTRRRWPAPRVFRGTAGCGPNWTGSGCSVQRRRWAASARASPLSS